MARKLCMALLAALTALALTAGGQGAAAQTKRTHAQAAGATLTVDNDRQQCPNARDTRIRDANDAAHTGDTIVVCAGTYAEGPGIPGSTALTITQSLNIRGAGADSVTIEPNRTGDRRIAESDPDLRNGKGVIIAVKGDKDAPITVNISGVTVDANGVDATAGIVFLDAKGSVNRSHVTGLAIDEGKNGYQVPGGFRSNDYGIGIAMVTRNKAPKVEPNLQPARTLRLDYTRIDHYNAVGLLVDGSTGNYVPTQTTPLVPTGIDNRAIVTNSQIVGRNSCQHYNDFTAGGQTDPDLGRLIVGDCQAGSNVRPPLPLYVGPNFGQDGVRATAGASVQISGTTISSNLVHGADAPVGSVFSPTPNNLPFALGNHAENNQNLRLGAGVRLVGAAASWV